MPIGGTMFWSDAASAATSDLLHKNPNSKEDAYEKTAVRLWLDGQISANASVRNDVSNVALIKIEIVDHSSDAAQEPLRETTFKMPAVSIVKTHAGLSEGEEALQGGGTIKRSRNGIDIQVSREQNPIHIDTIDGMASVDSADRMQKEVHFFGSPWEKTILTSDKGVRLSFSGNRLSSIQKDNIEDRFFSLSGKGKGESPSSPTDDELAYIFAAAKRADLARDLKHIESEQQEAAEFARYGEIESSRLVSAKAALDRGVLLEQVAAVAPNKSTSFNAAAENEMRSALEIVRDKFGAGTPETKSYVDALNRHLNSYHSDEMKGEMERLSFESRRASLMTKSIANIDLINSADLNGRAAQELRAGLISMHIAGGDNGLSSFVEDVNKRLANKSLKAPNDVSGFARHGAIIWTPEGSTRYSGSFDLNSK